MVYAGYSRIGRGNVRRRHKPKDEDYKSLCRSSRVGEGIRREGGRGRSGSRRELGAIGEDGSFIRPTKGRDHFWA